MTTTPAAPKSTASAALSDARLILARSAARLAPLTLAGKRRARMAAR